MSAFARLTATAAGTLAAAVLTPVAALAHGAHVVPSDGHSHGVIPLALALAFVCAAALVLFARRR